MADPSNNDWVPHSHRMGDQWLPGHNGIEQHNVSSAPFTMDPYQAQGFCLECNQVHSRLTDGYCYACWQAWEAGGQNNPDIWGEVPTVANEWGAVPVALPQQIPTGLPEASTGGPMQECAPCAPYDKAPNDHLIKTRLCANFVSMGQCNFGERHSVPEYLIVGDRCQLPVCTRRTRAARIRRATSQGE